MHIRTCTRGLAYLYTHIYIYKGAIIVYDMIDYSMYLIESRSVFFLFKRLEGLGAVFI